MKLIKGVVISIAIVIVTWFAIDLIRYGDYDGKKLIDEVTEDTLVLVELKILPEASYMPLEVKITAETLITGVGPQTLFLDNINDLKQGQKVRVWYNTNSDNENIAEKVVVYNLF
ncbi:hypothetical protein [Mesobacillus selenatarsenatis]|uniref:DUF3221 domain-containing protein n=1 Tax=Mesobacillus selenatarsenatis (strain DSM 18680 / JCM 14380 / FERM P-15431 / SF-1) TaxID=1321606 RepID=A0A0A8WZP9_MESS1|nr:hypothetical protein [Mesobacillus selenatarsenatis]GAM12247.1 hypothetical protein SAMD00020551_0379 [Mesobacillus selenatarsenatis SF-1]